MLTEKQLQERRHYIGGSDAGAICGLNPYRSPLDVYFEKVEGKTVDLSDNLAVQRGNSFEPVIRKEFSKVTGLKVTLPKQTKRHKQYDFLAANVDGICSDGNLVEIKTSSCSKLWQTDDMPPSYLCQCAHYAMIYNISKVYLTVLHAFNKPLKIYEYNRNKNLEDKLLKKLVAFWGEHVTRLSPPEPSTYKDALTSFPEGLDEHPKTATNEISDSYFELKELREFKKKEEPLKTKIMLFMGEATTLHDINGDLMCTWKNTKNGSRRFMPY